MKKLISILICLIIPAAWTLANSTETNKVYTLARAPQLSPLQLIKTWQPFVDYLSVQTNSIIKLKVYEKRSDFESDLIKGTPDFIYSNPGYFVVAKELHNYIPLIRSDDRLLKGILVTRKESPVNDISDLDGHSIAFPSPYAMAASLYLGAILSEKFQIEFSPHYLNTHDNVYRNVANGKFIAGGGVFHTLNSEPQTLKDTLRVVYETPGMAPHPLSAHPRVPGELRAAISKAVLKLLENEKGQALLNAIKLEQPIEADFERDYLPVRDLFLHMYEYLIKQ